MTRGNILAEFGSKRVGPFLGSGLGYFYWVVYGKVHCRRKKVRISHLETLNSAIKYIDQTNDGTFNVPINNEEMTCLLTKKK